MDNKLPQSIFGTIITWALTIATWSATHMALICGLFAILASIATTLAGWETYLYFREKRKRENK